MTAVALRMTAIAVVLVAAVTRIATASPDTPPVQMSAAGAHLVGLASLAAADDRATNIARALDSLGGESTDPIVIPQRRDIGYVIGRVELRPHRAPTGTTYALVIIDNRSHQALSVVWDADQEHDGASLGWDYGLDRAAKKRSWLQALDTSRYQANAQPTAVFVPPTATHIVFGAQLPQDALPLTDVHRDVSVVLLLLRGDRKLWWAEQLK